MCLNYYFVKLHWAKDICTHTSIF